MLFIRKANLQNNKEGMVLQYLTPLINIATV